MTKVIMVIMDSVGVGSLPDAAEFGDEGSNTLGHIAEAVGGLKLPHLEKMGLGRIIPIKGLSGQVSPLGAYGRMAEKSRGKDTTTGHWEIAGIFTKDPMPTFSRGFPAEFITRFEKRIGRKTLGNKVASGTEIIKELGEEHLRTGSPIVYTSADSVFQIAAHEEIIALDELYKICHIAREMLTGNLAVGRVIARPFIGKPGVFVRTANRHDYSLEPPGRTILDALKDKGEEVIGVGKISDIFAGRGLTASYPSKSNDEGISQTIAAWAQLKSGLIFTNLVEFDSQYGHRNDPVGYARTLEELDVRVPELLELVSKEGLLIITADHGNDPTTASTDHSREYVPLLVCGAMVKPGVDLGIRGTFADIAETLKEIFTLDFPSVGQSFLNEIHS